MLRERDRDSIIGNWSDDEDRVSFEFQDVYKLAGGVSVQWLARAFQSTRHKVDKKLMGLKPIGKGKHGNPLYDFVEAAELLVEPKVDLEKYIKTLKPEQLPDKLRETYWNSKLKAQRWEERAAHLWRTEIVIDKFSEVFMLVRTVLQLLPDEIERQAGLSDEQRKVAVEVVDGLQSDMHRKLLELSGRGYTPSQLGEIEDDEDTGYMDDII